MANTNIKKDEYVSKIIHDLENPIVAQITALESFLSTTSEKLSQEERDLIELTLNSCNYMQKLTEIFNSVYRLNFENIKLNYEKFNVTELIKTLIKDLNILLKYCELDIIFDCENEIIVNADKAQIKKVIEILLSNAVNYAFKNSTIKIRTSTLNGDFLFEIKNNSLYIEPQILKEVFEKHKTHPSLYNKNGVGLGLYLSREIIQAHQGSMIAKSTPENITIFGFKIPKN